VIWTQLSSYGEGNSRLLFRYPRPPCRCSALPRQQNRLTPQRQNARPEDGAALAGALQNVSMAPPLLAREPPRRAENPLTRPKDASTDVARLRCPPGINSTFSRLGSLLAIAILGLVVSFVFAARTDDPDLVPFGLGQDSPEFISASTAAFRAAMVLAAVLALAGSFTALGYSRLPKVAKAAEAAAAPGSPLIRLDPASPDCPASIVHHEPAEIVTAEPRSAAQGPR
jgi:hypothetical protein